MRPAEPMTTTIYVCTTCRAPDDPSPERAGQRLYADLTQTAESQGSDVQIVGVECLSVCKRPCTIAFSAAGKWTYIYGDFPADTGAETILAGAALYGAAADGLIPWKSRPDALKKGVVARLPPLFGSAPSPESVAEKDVAL